MRGISSSEYLLGLEKNKLAYQGHTHTHKTHKASSCPHLPHFPCSHPKELEAGLGLLLPTMKSFLDSNN